MLRYLRSLSDKDLALDRSMIPLGSCTMKLNATSEMVPITWPEFADIHPFAPRDQLAGYEALREQLEAWLCQATGYSGVSLQPNAGSQGEFAGLLVIKAWHEAQGQAHRNICLIPESAHGTNPASAQMAGLQVVVTRCDEAGNVDLADLAAKCEQHAPNLAAVMITYPSTYGVFDTQVKALCAVVHESWRPGVCGRRQHERPGWRCSTRGIRWRRQPPEPSQDILHSTRWRRARCRAGVCCRRPGALPAVASLVGHRQAGAGRGRLGSPAGQCCGVADQLDVHAHDGRTGFAGRHRDCDSVGELHCRAAGGALRGAFQRRCSWRQGRRCGARVHSRPQAAEGVERQSARKTWPSA